MDSGTTMEMAVLTIRSQERPVPRSTATEEVMDISLSEAEFYYRLASVIRDARETNGLSQREVAEALGHSTSTVNKWEKCKARLTAWDIIRLAELFKLPVELLADPPEPQLSIVQRTLLDDVGAGPRRPVPPALPPRGRGNRRARP